MTDEIKERVAKGLTIAVLAVVVAVGAFSVWPTYMRERSLKRQEAELTRSIEEKRREIARLVDLQKRFKSDPDLVERIARQNGRVYPGELVFIFGE